MPTSDVRLTERSYQIPVSETDSLHLKRIYAHPEGPVAFLLHGSIENGRIFYSRSLKGFGPFLARNGFDVYIPDLRGRGKSTPAISRKSAFGNFEAITEDIPAILEKITELRPNVPQHWVSHSWGGVLLHCYLIRNPKTPVQGLIHFGALRQKRVPSMERWLKVNLGWYTLMGMIVRVKGYAPAKQMGAGADNESRKTFYGTNKWMRKDAWQDEDGFDYWKGLSMTTFPQSLYLGAVGDKFLAQPGDVQRSMLELNQPNCTFQLLGKISGNLHDYDHNSMLIHPDAEKDHFPGLVNWMKS